jgi:hypothetical protein
MPENDNLTRPVECSALDLDLRLDHLVVGAKRLEDGVAYVEQTLGVSTSVGGKHAFMGTHNALLKLGHGEYLEVIAIDPDSPALGRVRWFGLDRLDLSTPRLIHWVARTTSIQKAVHEYSWIGPAVSASRGILNWQITIPVDGALPFDGVFPTIIEWQDEPHVSERMRETGCALLDLALVHPAAERIRTHLASTLHDGRISFREGEPGIVCTIRTPEGVKMLTTSRRI